MAGILLALCAIPARAQEASLVSVRTPRGAKQAFILLKPQNPVAAVILFAGGNGSLRLKSAATMTWGAQNFLVRTRAQFARQGFMVAVADAPSDQQGQRGMNAIFRMGSAHAADIGAIVAYLKQQANVPVWLVGTSMGTFSAAGGGIALKNVAGVVLASTISRSQPFWNIRQSHPNGVASMRLSAIAAPTLIVSHRHDACDITPAIDASKLTTALSRSRKVDVVVLDGGKAPETNPCGAMSPHGFYGIEDEAVARIAEFIKSN